MIALQNKQNIIFKILTLFLLMQGVLFADSYSTESRNSASSRVSNIQNSQEERVEVSLDSFGSVGIIIMIILTSLLGLFFVRNEFNVALE